MKKIAGHLKKLKSTLHADVVDYHLCLDQTEISLNTLLGKSISLTYTGIIHCIQCGRKTNTSFQQGFCFPCLRRLQECNLCIIHPERCQVEKGCPADDWAHAHCYQDHVVYLANSSELKVGITRSTQVPTRWIDQGAQQAIPIFSTTNRYQAGRIEVVLKHFISDRTDWRKMLRNESEEIDLIVARDTLLLEANTLLKETMGAFKTGEISSINSTATQLNYPVLQYPRKINSLSFEKNFCVSGYLCGIKGQYLILDTGVINIRKYGGYHVEFVVTV